MVFVTHHKCCGGWWLHEVSVVASSVGTTCVLIFRCCCYHGLDSSTPKLVSRCMLTLTPLVIAETSAQSAPEWGQLTPAEQEGVDGQRTAGGNNTAAGRLVPINVRQKWEILAGRPGLANFPKGCEVVFLTCTGIQGFMCLQQLNSCCGSRVHLWVFVALS